MLMKLLQAIQYREDTESFNGNLYRLLLLQAKDCPEMISWLHHRGTYHQKLLMNLSHQWAKVFCVMF